MHHRRSNFSVLLAVCLGMILLARFLPASSTVANAVASHTAEALIARAHVVPSYSAVAARPVIRLGRNLTRPKQKSFAAVISSRSLLLHAPACAPSAVTGASAAPANPESRSTSGRSPPACASRFE
jgi:hypothetical protein